MHIGVMIKALGLCIVDIMSMCLSNHINAITIALTDHDLGPQKWTWHKEQMMKMNIGLVIKILSAE